MQNVVDMRVKQLNIRLSDEEAERLERVAKHFGLNAAGVIRFLLKRADDGIESHGYVRAHGPALGGVLAAFDEAGEMVDRAAVPGVTLAVRDDFSDVNEKRFALHDGSRVVARDLDLVGLERALADLKAKSAPATVAALPKARSKKR